MPINPNAPEGTYSSNPFVSKDGLDSNGVRAEVKVITGYGEIIEYNDSTAGKTKQVKFAVHNTQHNPSGWTRDSQIQKKIEEAREGDGLIHFRIEVRRKEKVDRTLPIAEISTLAKAKESIAKSLAAVKLPEDTEWTISTDAVTRLDEDPITDGLVSAYNNTPEELSGKPAKSTQISNYEPAPYVGRLRSGAINPGTIGIHAALGFFSYLLEYERDEGVQIDKDKRKEIAHVLLLIANKLQNDIYEKKIGEELKGGVELTAGSHNRARFLIFESIRSFAPITEEVIADEEAFKKWQKAIYVNSYAMWEWAIDETDPYIS